MSNYITNGSPYALMLGTDDKSIPKIYPRVIPQPQLLFKFYFYGKKGSTIPELLGMSEALEMYGPDTFDKSKPFFNHTTHFINTIGSTGTSMMLQRIIPPNAGVPANLTVYLDVWPTTVPNYERNSDGSIATDGSGAKLVNTTTPTIDGFKVKLITESHDTEEPIITIKSGTQDGGNSNMYPLYTTRAAELGNSYNSMGLGIEAQDVLEVDPKIIEGAKALTYNLFRYSKETGTTVLKRTKYGADAGRFVLRPNAKNPLTKGVFDFPTVMNNEWSNATNRYVELMYNDYKNLIVYDDNIKDLLDLFVANESQYVSELPQTWHDGLDESTDTWFDFFSTGDDIVTNGEEYLFNIFNFRSMKAKVPYFSVQLSDDIPTLTGTQKEIRSSRLTPIYLEQGQDGDMTDENFNIQVAAELNRYLDIDDPVQDLAINKESAFVDTGFSLETKKALVNFIARRKDTFLFNTTHYHNLKEYKFSLSDARALSSVLLTRMRLAPESTHFSTPVMRGVIVAGDGYEISKGVEYRVSQVLELVYKASRMMGAGDGAWKREFLFDTLDGVASTGGNAITNLEQLRPDAIPVTIKPLLRKDGMVWSQSADRRSYHFPDLHTVYDNDLSVLKGIYAPLAICTIVKVANDAHIAFAGDMHRTMPVFARDVKNFMGKGLKNRFAGIFVITNEVVFTEEDKLRGYSWHVVSRIYAPSLKTFMIHHTEAYRYIDISNPGITQ